MELDQILFKKFIGLYEKWKTKPTEEEVSKTVHLAEINSRLTLIARALTGQNIEISPAEKEGGAKRHFFYLPASFSFLPTFEQNLNFYIFRVVYLSIQLEKNIKQNFPTKSLPLQDLRQKATEISPQILKILADEYPPVAQYYDSITPVFTELEIPTYWLYGKYMDSRDVFGEIDGGALDKHLNGKKAIDPKTEIQSKPVEEVEILTVDKKTQEDYMLTHNFEKVETAEEFTGVWRGFDGEDSLEDDSEALEELNLKHLVRSDETAHSVYQADFRDLVNIGESVEKEDHNYYLTYKEWDFGKKQYKPDYCKVYLKTLKKGDIAYAKKCISENGKTLNGLRRKFAQIHQKRETIRRLPDGEEIDMDALVDWYADLKAGKAPSDNIYLAKRKKASDLVILFLIDLSLSTDSYADGNRILDVEKQAVILLGEVLSEYNVEFAIGGFYSKTRNHCVYHSIKGFEENWVKGKQNLSAVQPNGYTRIGPAFRHSQTLIEKHPATNKWVILLSDGKPNDYDKYEGKYGVSDVKQALREMHEHHINTYAVAIESTAKYYLPQMFGQNHYNILSHPEELIASLAVLYRRINNG